MTRVPMRGRVQTSPRWTARCVARLTALAWISIKFASRRDGGRTSAAANLPGTSHDFK